MRKGRRGWACALVAAGVGWGFSAHAAPSICTAVAGNLVVNCGFETKDFSGWTTKLSPAGSSLGIETYAPDVNSGTYAAYFASETGDFDTITQAIVTTPGTDYQVTFFLKNTLGDPPVASSFMASFGGSQLLSVTNLGETPYTRYFADIVASTATTLLSFSAFNYGGGFDLDDVSVVAETPGPIPEPATLAAFGIGLLGLALTRRAR